LYCTVHCSKKTLHSQFRLKIPDEEFANTIQAVEKQTTMDHANKRASENMPVLISLAIKGESFGLSIQ